MPWIKAWHVIFMVTWFAGLFYLPRLFVYHASATDAAGIERFRVMESAPLRHHDDRGGPDRRLRSSGSLAMNPGLLDTGWLRAKLALVALLIAYPRLRLAPHARIRRRAERAQRALVPLVQRSPVVAPDRHRAARGRAPLLNQASASRACGAEPRSRHHAG